MITLGEIITLLGSIFLLLSAIGLIRMPDFLMRLQAASKASSFGLMLILIGGSMVLDYWQYEVVAATIFIFLLISTPIGAHALAKASNRNQLPIKDSN